MTILRLSALFVFSLFAFSAFAADGGDANVAVAVPARDIARGEVIAAGDLDLVDVPAARTRASILTRIADIAGFEARRSLRAGELVRASDVKKPVLVAKGSMVTMIYEAPGLRLVATGRAMSAGGAGDTVTVLNPVSYRQFEATVLAAGTVAPAGLAATNLLASSRP